MVRIVAAILLWVGVGSLAAETEVRGLASHWYQRLNGVPLRLNNPKRPLIESALRAGDKQTALNLITDEDNYYNVTLLHWASPLADRGGETRVDFNDVMAAVLGLARDQRDFREILSGDFRYVGPTKIKNEILPSFYESTKEYYRALQSNGVNYRRELVRVEPQWRDVPDAAGVLTSHAWGEAHLNMGTNRRAIEYAFKVFLCTSLEEVGDASVADVRVHRDVDRAPGGNPQTYQSTCRRCHAGMDSLVGSLAHLRFGIFPGYTPRVHWDEKIQKRMNQHGDVYAEGFVTTDDSWANRWTSERHEKLGWRGATQGRGIKELGQMLANSKAFSRCMATKVFTQVCRRSPIDKENHAISAMAEAFENRGYQLTTLFHEAVQIPSCSNLP